MRVEKRAIVGNIVMLQISKTKCLPLPKIPMDTIGLSKVEISDETKNSCSCDDLCINTGTSECARVSRRHLMLEPSFFLLLPSLPHITACSIHSRC